MSTVVLACQTISDELNLAMEVTGVGYPVCWVESGLHNSPQKLKYRIQEKINKIDDASVILLAFGYCGMALTGIKSHYARLILPKVDDCISLLLGSNKLRIDLSREEPTYFFTRGWIDGERSLLREYEYCVNKYGQKRGTEIMQLIFKEYKCMAVIETGAYNSDDCVVKTRNLAASFGLDHKIIKGSLILFQKLLLGPWDDDFIITEPDEEIVLDII